MKEGDSARSGVGLDTRLTTGRPVALSEADRELRKAWSAADEEARRSKGEGMLRLREVNLVVVAEESAEEESRKAAALVAREHPARVIVVVAGGASPGASEASTDQGQSTPGRRTPSASIATACTVDPFSHHHVCSEEVVIRGTPDDEELLCAAVLQLLMPDVPVVGWWVGAPTKSPDALALLAEMSDQIVVDLNGDLHQTDMSGGCAETGILERLRVLEKLGVGWSHVRLREMEWLRSVQWRLLTAEMFEQHERRLLIPSIDRVAVEHHRALVQALLYAAWFATSLGLQVGEGEWRKKNGSLCLELERPASGSDSRGERLKASRGAGGGSYHARKTGTGDRSAPSPQVCGPVVIELSGCEEALGAARGLTAVRVGTAHSAIESTGEQQALALRRGPRSDVCTASLGQRGNEMVVKSLEVATPDDVRLLSQVIDTPLREHAFDRVLQMATAMAGRPGFAPSGAPTHGLKRA